MARPTKQGIDFFPLDVEFDDKVELYIIENGAVSLSVLVTVWQLIYRGEGYCISYCNDLFLQVKRRILLDIDEVKHCIDAAIDRGIFSKDLFLSYKILTSSALQKRYFIAARKKKMVSVVKNYLCRGVSDVGNCNVKWVDIAENATKEEEEEELEVKEDIYSAAETAVDVDETKTYFSKKGRKLRGKVLEDFNIFWDAFAYKKGRAEAADAFLTIYSSHNFLAILDGAKKEAVNRQSIIDKGLTPIMAQGWISGRRWEDESSHTEEDEWI